MEAIGSILFWQLSRFLLSTQLPSAEKYTSVIGRAVHTKLRTGESSHLWRIPTASVGLRFERSGQFGMQPFDRLRPSGRSEVERQTRAGAYFRRRAVAILRGASEDAGKFFFRSAV